MEKKTSDIIHADDLSNGVGTKLSQFLQSFKSSDDDLIWSEQYYYWKIKQNPAGSGLVSLATSENNIVSSVSITPKLIWHRGKKIAGGEIGDTYTDKLFQRQGLFATLINEIKMRAHTSDYELIYGVPNEQSRPGYEKKCDFLSHPHFHLLSCIYLLNTPKIAANKKPGGFNQLLRFISPILNRFLHTLHFFWRFLSWTSGIKVKTIHSVDESYDLFWEKYKGQDDLLLIRDKAYLNFRFFKHPLAKYRFYEARKGNVLLGYLVSTIHQVHGRKDIFIADWFYNKKRPLAFFALLHRALKDGMMQKTGLFSTWVSNSSSDKWLLFLSGFIVRGKQPVIFHKNTLGIDILKNRDRWHFTPADSDNV